MRESGPGLFTAQHLQALEKIIEEKPQLYLDETQDEMVWESGRLWSTTTLWEKLHTLDYSLQTAVTRAKQQSDKEVNDYFFRMRERV
ncbi:MAG: hypothetical protein AAF517_25940, partial [Planctomycetota bacterium]